MKGSAITSDFAQYINDIPDMGFRIIRAYHIGSDSEFLRLDVLFEGKQFHVEVLCGEPEKLTGQIKANGSDLLTPSSGITSCQNVKVTRKKFVDALKELIKDIEEA